MGATKVVNLYVSIINPLTDITAWLKHRRKRLLAQKALDPATTWFKNDVGFDNIYPEAISAMSKSQWTPLHIAKQAAAFLAEPKARILDIGSGVGKFCLVAAKYHPDTLFYGVEQRQELVDIANATRDTMGLDNAIFLHGNITQINFAEYDHFYFYNSFYENFGVGERIDDKIETSVSLYNYYTTHLYRELNNKPAGTKLVTYHSLEQEIPSGYVLTDVSYDTLLKMWIKK